MLTLLAAATENWQI